MTEKDITQIEETVIPTIYEDLENIDVDTYYNSLDESLKKKVEDMSIIDRCVYSTNFLSLDILTGRNVRDEDTNELLYKVRGIREGDMILVTGNQSTGKSTCTCNIAGQVKRRADAMAKSEGKDIRSEIHVLNPENGMEPVSVLRNCGLSEEYMQAGQFFMPEGHKVSTEYFANYIAEIHKRKTENKEKYTITGITASNKRKKHLIPTIVILDSWSIMTPNDLRDVEKNSNMYDAQKIKENNKYLNIIFPLLKEANIILLIVVQMSGRMQTDKYNIKPADYQALKDDVKLSGGKALQYAADMIIYFLKVTDKDTGTKSRKTVSEIINIDDGNIGFATQCIFLKNRYGNSSFRSVFHLVFDSAVGFNPKYSFLYEVLNNENILTTSGGHRVLEGYKKKFYGKEIPTLCETDPEFLSCLVKRFELVYDWHLEAGNHCLKKHKEVNSFMNMLLNI